jgi:hypothetical protein
MKIDSDDVLDYMFDNYSPEEILDYLLGDLVRDLEKSRDEAELFIIRYVTKQGEIKC